MAELEQVEVLALLVPVVSPVNEVREVRLGHLVLMVNLDHQDSQGHPVSLASMVLQGSSLVQQVAVVVQVHRGSLVPQDPKAAREEQVSREKLIQRAHLVVLVSTSLS